MSRRKSKNRRTRFSNVTDVLDENTNVFGKDPLWVNRTSVRPSKSFDMTQNASSVLSPNSDVNATPLTDEWYKNLSHSDTSQIIRLISDNKTEEKNIEEYSAADTESNEEPTRKRSKLRTHSRKDRENKTSNLFAEAFDETKSSSKLVNAGQAPIKNESSSSNDGPQIRKKLRRKKVKTTKKPVKDNTDKSDDLNNKSLSHQNKDSLTSKTKSQLRLEAKSQNQNFRSHLFSHDTNIAKSMNEAENSNISSRSLRIKTNSSILSQTASPNRSSLKRSDSKLKRNLGNVSPSQRKISIVESWFDASCSPQNILKDDSIVQSFKEKELNSKTCSTSALHDVKNTIPFVNLKKPRVLMEEILLPGSKNYIPIEQLIQKPVESKSTEISDKTDQPVPKISNKKRPTTRAASNLSDSESTQSDFIHSPTPAQSTLKFHGKPMTDFGMSTIPETSGFLKQNKNIRQPIDDSEDSEDIVLNVSNQEELPINKHTCQLHAEKLENKTSTTDDEEVKAFFNETLTKTKKQLALRACTSNIDPKTWEKVRENTEALKKKIEARDKHEKDIQREQEKKSAVINAQLRRIQALRDSEKKKRLRKPIDKAYYVKGELYKQPRLPRPKKWATPKLYQYLWKAMESKFGRKTRIASEKFVLKLSNIYTVIIRRSKYENYEPELNDLLLEMAKLNIIKTRYDFYRFCSEFMPSSFHNKVVPMMLPGNKRNIPYDPESVNKPILSESSSDNDSVENPKESSKSDSESE